MSVYKKNVFSVFFFFFFDKPLLKYVLPFSFLSACACVFVYPGSNSVSIRVGSWNFGIFISGLV